MLFHIHLFGVLIAVHIDVDDVLALAESLAVDCGLAVAGVTMMVNAAIDITKGVSHQSRHLSIMVDAVVNGHQIAAIIQRKVVGETFIATIL